MSSSIDRDASLPYDINEVPLVGDLNEDVLEELVDGLIDMDERCPSPASLVPTTTIDPSPHVAIVSPDNPRINTTPTAPSAVAPPPLSSTMNLEQFDVESSTAVVPTKLIFSPSTTTLVRVQQDDIASNDILCSREFTGTRHAGNRRYLRIIKKHKARYLQMGSRHGEKTKIRNMIVDTLVKNGGRFVRKTRDGQHYLLTLGQARSKVSQALREKGQGEKVND